MYVEQIPVNAVTTTLIKIKYDCKGGFERCDKEWTLKLKDAQKNFEKNNGKHICRQCNLKNNNPAKRDDVKVKIKKTNIKRYGATCALNTPENIQARNEKIFGSEEKVQEMIKKRRATSKEKYGTDHPMQNDEVKAKQQAVLEQKYGVAVPLQNPEILAKMKKTVKERYGVENVAAAPEVRIKMAKTTLEKYGVEHYNQLPEMKEYLRQNCKEWLAESYAAGGPNKGITRPEAWNQKQSQTVCDLIEAGEWSGGGIKTYQGYYQAKKCCKTRPMFRSGYELQVHFWLDNNDEVEFYDYEPFQIPYYDTEGVKRHYTVDFIVKFRNGDVLVIEVKNNYNSEEFLQNGKYQTLSELCFEHGMKCEIWKNDKIKSLGSKVSELLESSQVEVTRRPTI